MPSKTPPQLVVPHPIPDDPLRRVVVPTVEQVEYPRGIVPGTVVTVSGDSSEAPVEMVEGNPAPPITKAPVFIPRVEEWPVHLTAQVLLQPGKNGSPNIQSLRAPANAWMRVDEIKFEVVVMPSDNPDITLQTYVAEGFGAVVGVGLSLKGRALTSGFVPMALFGPSRKLVHERQIFTNPGNTQARIEQYSWPLAVPVYVPPGAILEPVFEHKGYVNYNVRARISYAGALMRQAPNPVDIAKLPFASAWVGSSMTLDGSNPEVTSDENSLVGPKGAEFNIEYMIGRLYMRLQTADYFALVESDFDTAGPFPGGQFCAYSRVTNQIQARVVSSWGDLLTLDYLCWWSVFDRVNRQLEAAHKMPTDGFYTVEVRDVSGAAMINTALLPLVSLVGWQEVAS